jgi:hypothetical protein
MDIDVVDSSNKKVGTLALSDELFGQRVKTDLIWEGVVHEQASARSGTHKAKTRSEVQGSGKKLWKQKGTGRARVSDVRNPIWRKGGSRVPADAARLLVLAAEEGRQGRAARGAGVQGAGRRGPRRRRAVGRDQDQGRRVDAEGPRRHRQDAGPRPRRRPRARPVDPQHHRPVLHRRQPRLGALGDGRDDGDCDQGRLERLQEALR